MIRVDVYMTPQQVALLDAIVPIYGSSRSDALRYIFASWSTDHIKTLGERIDAYQQWKAEQR